MMKILKKIGKIIAIVGLTSLGLLFFSVLLIYIQFTRLNQTNGTIISSGQERRYLLYVPPTYNPAILTPLVINLHGFVQWPAHQMQLSGWNDLADKDGFIVVYPEGTKFPRRWNAGGQARSKNVLDVDVEFISDLIDKLEKQYNIDPTRIYANGLSNGGGMSYVLGCQLSNRITAVGGVAGAYVYPLTDCRPTRPVPMIVFHGTDDPIVPYLGGYARGPDTQLPDLPNWVAKRAILNGCSGSPIDLPAVGAVSGIAYNNCDQGAEVAFYTIQGGGHTWPGGEPLPDWLAGYTSNDIEATRVMWEFFSRFTLIN